GGDIFCLYYEAASRRVHFLSGAGRSGTRATLDELRRRGLSRVPTTGPGAVSVPGCVRGWVMLLERFGTRPLAALLAPAVHYAGASRLERDGVLLPGDLATHTAEWGEPLRTTYRGYTVYETGLPTQGLAALLALNLLEGLDLGRIPLHSAEHLHALIETVKLA